MSFRIPRGNRLAAEMIARSCVASHALSRKNTGSRRRQAKRYRSGLGHLAGPARIGAVCIRAVLVAALVPSVARAQPSPKMTRASLVDEGSALVIWRGVVDCNENGVDDADDVANLTSPDCNSNGIPDECEIDENSIAPGGPFFCNTVCDPDCNRSGVPDECELSGNDCNADGRPDECGVFKACDSTEDQKLTASDPMPGDAYGYSVSMSGATAVVGARSADCSAGDGCLNSGAAFFFRFDGTSGMQQQRLNASDAASADGFGVSVGVSGDTAVIGASSDELHEDAEPGDLGLQLPRLHEAASTRRMVLSR